MNSLQEAEKGREVPQGGTIAASDLSRVTPHGLLDMGCSTCVTQPASGVVCPATIVSMCLDHTDDQLTALLSQCKSIAVVGLSDNPLRPSYGVARYMQAQGYRIVPVNPKGGEILGEHCYKNLSEIPFAVDMVNVFRRTEDVLSVAQELVQHLTQLKPICFWQQLEIANKPAAALAKQAGIQSVLNRCLKIDHARLIRRNA